MLRHVDSFDHYATADIEGKYNQRAGNGVGNPVISAANGRNGTASMRVPMSGNGYGYVTKLLDAQATWIVGVAFRTTDLTAMHASGTDIVSLRDGGSLQCDLRVNRNGTLTVTRNGTALGTTVFALSNNTYYFIEWKLKVDPAAGTVDVNVNGVNMLTLSGQNTRATANSSANEVTLGCRNQVFGSTGYCDFDDLYVADGQAGRVSDLIGDKRVVWRAASAAGDVTNFARGGADSGANWSQVDDSAPNGDTDFNYSSTPGASDLYQVQNLVQVTGDVYGAQTVLSMRKDDAGDRLATATIRSNSVDDDGADHAPGTDYAFALDVWEDDPGASPGTAFTIDRVNNLQMGPKVTG